MLIRTHRRRRLTGATSLIGLALRALALDPARSHAPTAPRLRRDIGLPEIELLPPAHPLPHRRT